jgi:hypothetical protein
MALKLVLPFSHAPKTAIQTTVTIQVMETVVASPSSARALPTRHLKIVVPGEEWAITNSLRELMCFNRF